MTLYVRGEDHLVCLHLDISEMARRSKRRKMRPEHRWLIDREWVPVGELRLGQRIIDTWTHVRNGDLSFVTDEAIFNQLCHEAIAGEGE